MRINFCEQYQYGGTTESQNSAARQQNDAKVRIKDTQLLHVFDSQLHVITATQLVSYRQFKISACAQVRTINAQSMANLERV